MPPTPRTEVRLRSIEPSVPQQCVKCLNPPQTSCKLAFRRSDASVERVCVVYWPYCETCFADHRHFDHAQRWMSTAGFLQFVWVCYATGGAVGYYDFWYPSLAIFALLFVAFIKVGKKARALWESEWARIDDVYKGGYGAGFSFANPDYAQIFISANSDSVADVDRTTTKEVASQAD
jgi:hypothetical protein